MKDLQTLSDEAEIRALTCRYSDCYDRADAEDYGGTFLVDGLLDSRAIGFGTAIGPDAVADVLRSVRPQQAHVIHLVTNHLIEITGPDAARGSCYYIARSRLHNGGRGEYVGRYEDEYRRTPDGWRFARRVIVPLLPPEAEGFA
jgi:hypothetical protein